MKRRFIAVLLLVVVMTASACPVFADEVATKWKAEKKSKAYETKGKWKEACRRYYDGKQKPTISCSEKKSVCSTYSGTLKISYAKLESFAKMHYEIKKVFSVSVKDEEDLTGLEKGTYAIQWRPVYTTHKVTQRKYQKIDKKWKKTATKKYVYPKDYKSVAFRLIKLSDDDIT